MGACSGMVSCHDIAVAPAIIALRGMACLPQTSSDRVFVYSPF